MRFGQLVLTLAVQNLSVDEVAKFADKYDFVSRRSSLEITRGRIRVDPHKLTMPSLVVGGKNDVTVTPATARAIADFYGAAYIQIDNLAHDLMNDTGWEEAAEEIAQWLGGLPE